MPGSPIRGCIRQLREFRIGTHGLSPSTCADEDCLAQAVSANDRYYGYGKQSNGKPKSRPGALCQPKAAQLIAGLKGTGAPDSLNDVSCKMSGSDSMPPYHVFQFYLRHVNAAIPCPSNKQADFKVVASYPGVRLGSGHQCLGGIINYPAQIGLWAPPHPPPAPRTIPRL